MKILEGHQGNRSKLVVLKLQSHDKITSRIHKTSEPYHHRWPGEFQMGPNQTILMHVIILSCFEDCVTDGGEDSQGLELGEQ